MSASSIPSGQVDPGKLFCREAKLCRALYRAVCFPAYRRTWRRWTYAASWSSGFSTGRKQLVQTRVSCMHDILIPVVHRSLADSLHTWASAVATSPNPRPTHAVRTICRAVRNSVHKRLAAAWCHLRESVLAARILDEISKNVPKPIVEERCSELDFRSNSLESAPRRYEAKRTSVTVAQLGLENAALLESIRGLQHRVRECETEKMISDRNCTRSEYFARLSFQLYAQFQRWRTRSLSVAWQEMMGLPSRSRTNRRGITAYMAYARRGAPELASLASVINRRRLLLISQIFTRLLRFTLEKRYKGEIKWRSRLLVGTHSLVQDLMFRLDHATGELAGRKMQLAAYAMVRLLDLQHDCVIDLAFAFHTLKRHTLTTCTREAMIRTRKNFFRMRFEPEYPAHQLDKW